MSSPFNNDPKSLRLAADAGREWANCYEKDAIETAAHARAAYKTEIENETKILKEKLSEVLRENHALSAILEGRTVVDIVNDFPIGRKISVEMVINELGLDLFKGRQDDLIELLGKKLARHICIGISRGIDPNSAKVAIPIDLHRRMK